MSLLLYPKLYPVPVEPRLQSKSGFFSMTMDVNTVHYFGVMMMYSYCMVAISDVGILVTLNNRKFILARFKDCLSGSPARVKARCPLLTAKKFGAGRKVSFGEFMEKDVWQILSYQPDP